MTELTITVPAALRDRAPFPVADDEIGRLFAPYVVEEVSTRSARYAEEVERQVHKLERASKRGPDAWMDDRRRRTTEQVDSGYTRLWSGVSLAEQVSSPKEAWFEWRDRAMLARTIGRKHLHHLLLVRALEWLHPASAVEVGFGYGFNLLLLSMQFPEMRLGGVELTSAGVAAARALLDNPRTSDLLAPFAALPPRQHSVSPCPPWSAPSLDVTMLQQGSADALPFDSKSVDVTFTVLALEQMENIRAAALAELARVARRYVIMIEPFRDWNPAGLRRQYIEGKHYFDAAVADLEAHGLRPIVATADFPNKINFYAGLVIAEVA